MVWVRHGCYALQLLQKVVVGERMSVVWGEKEVGVKVGRIVGRRKPNSARHTLTCELNQTAYHAVVCVTTVPLTGVNANA
jgi:hypothetical protein